MKPNEAQQLANIIDAISQSVIEASDEEILEDAAIAGIDAHLQALEMRRKFREMAKAMPTTAEAVMQAEKKLESVDIPIPEALKTPPLLHRWERQHGWMCCAMCGIVRRRDLSNEFKACKGPVSVGPRIVNK